MKKLLITTICLSIIYSCKKEDNTVPKDDESETTDNTDWCSTVEFNAGITFNEIVDIEGNSYKTVIIDDQEWMAENLKVTKFSNGDPISNISNDLDWENTTSPAYHWIEMRSEGAPTIDLDGCFGYIYNGYVIEDTRNLCPIGWHIPSIDEFDTLIKNVEDLTTLNEAGLQLKSNGGWPSYGIGTDQFGFRWLPSGGRANIGHYEEIGYIGVLWSTDISEPGFLKSKLTLSMSSDIEEQGLPLNAGAPVRCLKD